MEQNQRLETGLDIGEIKIKDIQEAIEVYRGDEFLDTLTPIQLAYLAHRHGTKEVDDRLIVKVVHED